MNAESPRVATRAGRHRLAGAAAVTLRVGGSGLGAGCARWLARGSARGLRAGVRWGHAPVPAADPVDAGDGARPMVERVTAERAVAVAVGVGEHLVGDDDREVVSPGE